MSILTANNLSLSFGAFDVFRNTSISIANDSKIGLIGPNGIGKTSLLFILAGITAPTTGQVHVARGKRIGYLHQEAIATFADRNNTVFSEMLTVFQEIQAQQRRLNELEESMASGSFSDEILEEYGELQHAFEGAGGYDYENTIQQTLQGLGLGKQYWDMPLNHLSGGQKTRALLARLLLEKPDLLMLDEPTNHLDIEAVEWLEHTLQEWSGAVLIVSHDRYFLDNAATTIWEMTRTSIQEYSGNYNAYLLQRQEKWEYYERVFKEEKARLLNEVDFIERNWVRASTHARALGRLRRLSREIAIVENFGILALRGDKKWIEMDLHVERRLDVVEAVRAVNAISMQSNRPACIRPRLTSNQVSGNIVLRLDQVTIGYPGNPLFSTRNAELRRGECVALLGPNGSGKTSLVKTLLGQIEPLKGLPHLGASLKIGYFAQAHDGLQGDQSVLDELNSHKEMLPEKARSYLAAYLFRGDDIFKPLNALSGGERARLALAFMALDGANFLLLDEPTNHLDIPAQEALQEVLQNFNGTILLISHDRYFIDSLATHIWEIQGKELRCFHGRYREYILSRTAAVQGGQPRQVLLTPKPILRGNEKAVRKQVQNLNLLEERIRTHETSLTRLYNLVQKAYERNATEQSQRLNTEIARTQAELELLIREWEVLAIQTT